MVNKLGLFIALLFVCETIVAQVYNINDFKEVVPPKVNSEEWYKLNWSQNSFWVEANDKKIQISERQKQKGKERTCEYSIPTGKLIGTDAGEWGGKLVFQPKDTDLHAKVITSGNIQSIFNFQGKVYVVEALAHMTLNRGGLFLIDTSSLVYAKVLDLEDYAPSAVSTYKDMILVASHNGFYVIKNSQREDIITNAFWDGLYPTSIDVIDDENVFVGLRGGIAKINLNTRTFIYYQYKYLKTTYSR